MNASLEHIDGWVKQPMGRRGVLGGIVGASAAALALAACGTVATTGNTSTKPDVVRVALTVVGGLKLGPDGKMHDVISPSDFTVVQNRPVEVTVYSYDDAPHNIAAPDLNLNATLTPSTAKGSPGMTTFTFTPSKAGKFLWNCSLPCDGDANGWAMEHPGYMSGYITVAAA